VRKLLCWIVLLAATPATALCFERKNSVYFCTAQFEGGVAYDDTTKQWHGTIFQPTGNFVVRVTYLQLDEYEVSITDQGESKSYGCTGHNATNPKIGEYDFLDCYRLGSEYQFNFKTNRFLKAYLLGYLDGRDNNENTPSISGGVCTKID
jgi:hypothetical protein